jgi:hypothetical protein
VSASSPGRLPCLWCLCPLTPIYTPQSCKKSGSEFTLCLVLFSCILGAEASVKLVCTAGVHHKPSICSLLRRLLRANMEIQGVGVCYASLEPTTYSINETLIMTKECVSVLVATFQQGCGCACCCTTRGASGAAPQKGRISLVHPVATSLFLSIARLRRCNSYKSNCCLGCGHMWKTVDHEALVAAYPCDA